MPISYTIEQPHGLIRRTFIGGVGLGDFASHWHELLSDPALTSQDPLLLFADMRGASIDLDGPAVKALVENEIKPRLNGRRWISAIVVGSPAAFGTPRQFSIYSSDCGETAVFYNEEEALAWILTISDGPVQQR